MALSKPVVSNEGYTTNYHRISEISLAESDLIVMLSSYVSSEYRNLERPALVESYRFKITVEEEESMGIRQLAYKKLKELPEWADAEDC